MSDIALPQLSKLIAALQIFLKYGDMRYPTHCEHDVLMVLVDPQKVGEDDIVALKRLGFIADYGESRFNAYGYGAC